MPLPVRRVGLSEVGSETVLPRSAHQPSNASYRRPGDRYSLRQPRGPKPDLPRAPSSQSGDGLRRAVAAGCSAEIGDGPPPGRLLRCATRCRAHGREPLRATPRCDGPFSSWPRREGSRPPSSRNRGGAGQGDSIRRPWNSWGSAAAPAVTRLAGRPQRSRCPHADLAAESRRRCPAISAVAGTRYDDRQMKMPNTSLKDGSGAEATPPWPVGLAYVAGARAGILPGASVPPAHLRFT